MKAANLSDKLKSAEEKIGRLEAELASWREGEAERNERADQQAQLYAEQSREWAQHRQQCAVDRQAVDQRQSKHEAMQNLLQALWNGLVSTQSPIVFNLGLADMATSLLSNNTTLVTATQPARNSSIPDTATDITGPSPQPSGPAETEEMDVDESHSDEGQPGAGNNEASGLSEDSPTEKQPGSPNDESSESSDEGPKFAERLAGVISEAHAG